MIINYKTTIIKRDLETASTFTNAFQTERGGDEQTRRLLTTNKHTIGPFPATTAATATNTAISVNSETGDRDTDS